MPLKKGKMNKVTDLTFTKEPVPLCEPGEQLPVNWIDVTYAEYEAMFKNFKPKYITEQVVISESGTA